MDQLKRNTPSICDARRLVSCRPGGNGETEFLPDESQVRLYLIFCEGPCSEHAMVLQVSRIWILQQCVEGTIHNLRSVQEGVVRQCNKGIEKHCVNSGDTHAAGDPKCPVRETG